MKGSQAPCAALSRSASAGGAAGAVWAAGSGLAADCCSVAPRGAALATDGSGCRADLPGSDAAWEGGAGWAIVGTVDTVGASRALDAHRRGFNGDCQRAAQKSHLDGQLRHAGHLVAQCRARLGELPQGGQDRGRRERLGLACHHRDDVLRQIELLGRPSHAHEKHPAQIGHDLIHELPQFHAIGHQMIDERQAGGRVMRGQEIRQLADGLGIHQAQYTLHTGQGQALVAVGEQLVEQADRVAHGAG